MPARLAVDRESVKAHAMIHGLTSAAECFGLAVGTVKSWSGRDPDGPWLKRPLQQLATTVQPVQPATLRTASQAATAAMQKRAHKCKVNVAKWGQHATGHAAALRGEAALAAAQGVQATTRALANARLPGWEQSDAPGQLHLHMHRGTGPDDVPERTIDV